MSRHNEIIYEVVAALAAANGTDPGSLEYTLADYVDPTMIERVVASNTATELSFQVPGHEVTVTADAEVFIDGISYRTGRRSPISTSERSVDGNREMPDQRQLQRFFTNLPCTVYQSRNEAGWPIEFISGNCHELTGYEPNAFIIGGVNFGFDLIHPDDCDRVDAAVDAAIESESPFSVMYRLQTADGVEKNVIEIGMPLFDGSEPLSIVGAIVDLTDMNQEQAQAVSSLEQANPHK
ncbi:PAS fold-3 domain-containing protein [Natrialba chahannaoensis JCM 10990]|uniref:histidine kinase n=1 Tax=Natrialba chahannaoensis JCM 10990 TaxID=1227492 RepID=M0AUP2_9EURY|nr:PAS domain-containing protein [Natrialba chahannaoensis]ELZ01084.1 PAS fold-3 domain-containing protein [Natrialba chahannaoensis JCM 10990]